MLRNGQVHEGEIKFNELDLSYRLYKRKKKRGFRIITAPNPELKRLQGEFLSYLNKEYKNVFDSNKHITGFVPGSSIQDNAKPHLSSEWILNLDIKDFFPSITEELLVSEFYKNLDFKGFTPEQLGKLTCYNGKLPQGSPASPAIANLVALRLIDPTIIEVAEMFGFKYTRYADDLTFSISRKLDRNYVKKFADYIIEFVNKSQIFKINPTKINIKHSSQRQMVTGIVVNNQDFSVSKPVRNKLRAILYQHKIQDKPLDDKINGVLSFIKQINKDQYQKLTKDFPCKLLMSDFSNQTLPLHQLQRHMDSLS